MRTLCDAITRKMNLINVHFWTYLEFSPKNEARKAYLHLHKRIIITPAIYERGLFC